MAKRPAPKPRTRASVAAENPGAGGTVGNQIRTTDPRELAPSGVTAHDDGTFTDVDGNEVVRDSDGNWLDHEGNVIDHPATTAENPVDAEVEMETVDPTDDDLARADALEAEAAKLREPKQQPVQVAHDSNTHIGFGGEGGGIASYIEAPEGWNRDREILYAGVRYEHVSDDADGCWIYRHLDRHP